MTRTRSASALIALLSILVLSQAVGGCALFDQYLKLNKGRLTTPAQ